MPLDPKTNENSHTTMGRSCDINPNGSEVAVGMRDGLVRIYALSVGRGGVQSQLKY